MLSDVQASRTRLSREDIRPHLRLPTMKLGVRGADGHDEIYVDVGVGGDDSGEGDNDVIS